MNDTHNDSIAFGQVLEKMKNENYRFRLYVAGMTPSSVRAITNIKIICEENLKGCYELEVIDLYQNPTMAKDEQIIAVPTLIKKQPLPVRRIIGDLSVSEQVLVGLGISKSKKI